MTNRSVIHGMFRIERHYDASPARVFAAFSDAKTKRRWFAEGEGWEVESFETDFRIGGFENSRFRFKGGPLITNDTVFQDIVPDQRIIIAYHMAVGGIPISASLATIEFTPADKGTRMVFTEQDAFLDGQDNIKQREEGSRELMEALARELARAV